jgi:hypothetical protein
MTLHLIWQIPLVASLLFAVLAVGYFKALDPFLEWWGTKTEFGVCVLLSQFAIVAGVLSLLIWLYDVLYNVTLGALLFWQWQLSKSMLDHRWRLTFSDRLQYIVGNHNFHGTWHLAQGACTANRSIRELDRA